MLKGRCKCIRKEKEQPSTVIRKAQTKNHEDKASPPHVSRNHV